MSRAQGRGSKKSRMKGEDRRRQLLEASIACFSEFGYQGTTTAKLAKAAHISEPVLYQHFSSKQDLFVVLLEEMAREVIRVWKKAVAPLRSPLDQLRVIMRLNPATADPRGQHLYRIIFSAQAEFNEPMIQAALRSHYQQYARFLSSLLKRCQRVGLVRKDVSAVGLAWQLIHSAIGFALIKPLEVPGHATPATVEQVIGLLMEQLSGQLGRSSEA